MLFVGLVPLVAFAFSFWRDPRKFRTALYLLITLFWFALAVVGAIGGWASSWDEFGEAYVLLAVIVLGLFTVIGFAAFLIASGITLVRREGVGISRLLSIGLGVGLLAYVGLVIAVVATNSARAFTWLLLLGLPAAYLGFAFVAFLLYGALYPALMARWGGPVAAVVVLGSGLIEGRVPPLLAARLLRGRQVLDRSGVADAVLVTSGGRGVDEPVAEATAMADFLVADGFPAEQLLAEDRSRNTDENLSNTAMLLASRGIDGPIAVVTSNFHAYRAALLMRRHGLAGYAVGAPTVRYYWASAVIREFLAILRDHRWLNIILLGLSALPLILALGTMLLAQR